MKYMAMTRMSGFLGILLMGMTGLAEDPQPAARGQDGRGEVTFSGEFKQWHKITLDMDGPYADERDAQPNPFTDYAFEVIFEHSSGAPRYRVPGYFAADGQAGETSAQSGTTWRVHLSPDKVGQWTYRVSFRKGPNAAVEPGTGQAHAPFDGHSGTFSIRPTDKQVPDFRARGRLSYVGRHHLQFQGSKSYFLKVGPDAPETLLAYADFDGTRATKKNVPLKTWKRHVRDWKAGDPSWQNGKGKGLIGALNYLSGKGVNSFSFLPYNAGGDGDNIWPFVKREDKRHYDCSKLDQWGLVFEHATGKGLYLHFKMQENEMDDDRRGHAAKKNRVPESLDGGRLGVERKLYCRELIARFAHNLALNWNLGEESTQSTEEIRDMARYLHQTDPYQHHIVIHTFPNQQDKVYSPLLGDGSRLTGASLQNSWDVAHQRTLKWVEASAKAGKPWVVANDEQGPAGMGAPPDPGYQGHSGQGRMNNRNYDLHDIRKACLWGTLTAGGAGVEYYFGYKLPENDLLCEDFRSRDRSWDYGRIAIQFFQEHGIPFWEMSNVDALVGNSSHDNSRYALAKAGDTYVVYLPNGGDATLDLSGVSGKYTLRWFNPRQGGALAQGSVHEVSGGRKVSLGTPPADAGEDWVILVRSAS